VHHHVVVQVPHNPDGADNYDSNDDYGEDKCGQVQPSSDLLFMCRKYTRCTTICTTAVTRMVPRIAACDAEPLITIANGITVRMIDRMKSCHVALHAAVRSAAMIGRMTHYIAPIR
jgi:hypothetical protein